MSVNGTSVICNLDTDEINFATEANFATRAIHVGQSPSQWNSGALIPPISLSSTYAQHRDSDVENEFDYSRSGNPTRKCLEQSIASLECGKYGLCFSTGMGTSVTISHLLSTGDHIICFDDIYGGTQRYFRNCITRFGVEISFVDCSDLTKVASAIKENTKMIWLESPTNPLQKLVDISGIVNVVKQSNAKDAFVVVDNTFMSAYFQNPLKLGADIAMHSLTKYMNGELMRLDRINEKKLINY